MPDKVTYEIVSELTLPPGQYQLRASATSDKLSALLCCLPEAAVPDSVGYADTFRVVVSQFLDRFNFDIGTVKRSCVHFVQPDGQIIPFDTYNTFYRAGAPGAEALARGRAPR